MKKFRWTTMLLSSLVLISSVIYPVNSLAAAKDKTPPVLKSTRIQNLAKVTLSFNLSEDAVLKVKVTNQKKALVRTLTNGQKVKKGPVQITWGKIDNKKQPIAPGTYTIVVTATDNAGNTTTKSFSVIIKKTDTAAPILSSIVVSPTSFKKGGMITVIFNNSEKAKITLKVFNANHEEVYQLTGNFLDLGGNYVMWNGTMNGKFTGDAPAGTYSLELTAADEANNISTPYHFTVTKN